jgi:hypothetical protein
MLSTAIIIAATLSLAHADDGKSTAPVRPESTRPARDGEGENKTSGTARPESTRPVRDGEGENKTTGTARDDDKTTGTARTDRETTDDETDATENDKRVGDLSREFSALKADNFAQVCQNIIKRREGEPVAACVDKCAAPAADATPEAIKAAIKAAIECAQSAKEKEFRSAESGSSKDALEKARNNLKDALLARVASLPADAQAKVTAALQKAADAEKARSEKEATTASLKEKVEKAKAKLEDIKATKTERVEAAKQLREAASDAERAKLAGNRDRIAQRKIDKVKARIAKLNGRAAANADDEKEARVLKIKIDIAEDKLERLNARLAAEVDEDAEALDASSEKVTKDEKGEKDSIATTDPATESDEKTEEKTEETDGDDTEKTDGDAEKTAEKTADKPADKPAEKPADKPAEKPADKPAEATAKPATKKRQAKTLKVEVWVPTSKGGITLTTLQVTNTVQSEGGTVESVDTFGQEEIDLAKPIVATEKATTDKAASSAAALTLAAVAALMSVVTML